MDETLKSEKNRMHNLIDKVIGTSKQVFRARKDIGQGKSENQEDRTDAPVRNRENTEKSDKSSKDVQREQIHHKKAAKSQRVIFKKLEVAKKSSALQSLTPEDKNFQGETPIVAIDCEMVLCTDTQKHLARLSIVNYNRVVLMDEYVRPEVPVKNYLSHITNIDAFKLSHAKTYEEIKPKVEAILKGKLIVGHTIESDLSLLGLHIQLKNVRDIAVFSFFMNGKFRRGLKELCNEHLGIQIQTGIHSSVEDARATLELYKLYQKEIDRETKDLIFAKNKPLSN